MTLNNKSADLTARRGERKIVMFAIMYETEDGKVFKVVKTLDEAQKKAHALSLKGYSVTVFDYDMTDDEYLEFYTV